MKLRKIFKKIMFVFCLIFCSIAMTVNTFAYTSIDVERKASLTLVFKTETAPLSNVTFKLYYVDDVLEAGAVAPVQNMEAYIKENKMVPVQEKTTDIDGILSFTGLETGVYLVVGESYNDGIKIYTPTAFSVRLPSLNAEMDTWDYEVVANVKYVVEMDTKQTVIPRTGDMLKEKWYILLVGCSTIMSFVLYKQKKMSL